MDGTFLKNQFKRVLLVACFKDGKNNIRFIGVAVCSTENEENWKWFMELVKKNILKAPIFFISERERTYCRCQRFFWRSQFVFFSTCVKQLFEEIQER